MEKIKMNDYDYQMKQLEEIHDALLTDKIYHDRASIQATIHHISDGINRLSADNRSHELQYEQFKDFLTNTRKDTEKKILTKLNWFYAWNLIVIASVIISLLVK
tara:strand:- start:274 stop:585 length:312 start_codon:yes stop_codon:yes gene_type:complete